RRRAAAHRAPAGGAVGTGNRRHERRSGGTQILCASRRHGAGGTSASGALHCAARRTRHRSLGGGGTRQPVGAALRQPAVRSSLPDGALCQQGWHGRRALGSRQKSVRQNMRYMALFGSLAVLAGFALSQIFFPRTLQIGPLPEPSYFGPYLSHVENIMHCVSPDASERERLEIAVRALETA